MTYETEYALGQRVYVPALETWSHVQMICIGDRGVSYEIAYFHNGERRSCYVFAKEIRMDKG